MAVFMKTYGIRILDKCNRIVSVTFQEILGEIKGGNLFRWSLLYFYGRGHLKNGKSMSFFEEEVNNSEHGTLFSWDSLLEFAESLDEVIDMLIIASKDPLSIVRYSNDQAMYEACEVVIEMVDSSYWEVFSKDRALIVRLAQKFKQVEFLNSDLTVCKQKDQ
jgi:hypothetical protein